MAKPTPEQLAKINRIAQEKLDAEDIYVHPYLMLGTKYIPSHKMQFDRSLLEVYLQNIENNKVVQIANHDFSGYSSKSTLPYGRFFEGEIRDNNGVSELWGTRYMVSGLPTYIQAFTTDDINRMINTGILKDSSVSVSWGFSQCSICGNDIRDYENCKHWPGRTYKVNEQDVECRVIAKPAQPPKQDYSRMHENSDVVAGAYEDASVKPKGFSVSGQDLSDKPPNRVTFNNIADLKLVNKDTPVFCCLSSTCATFHIKSEDLRDASELHQMYHDMYSDGELPEGWTMAKLTQKHKGVVKELIDAGHDHVMQDALDGSINDSLKAKSTKGSDNNVDDKEKLAFEKQIEDLKTELSEKESALTVKDTEIAELKVQAELGKKYREDAIENAIEAGVRDQGNDFDEDIYREMFKDLDIEKVKSFALKWEASAVAKLGVTQHTESADLNLPDSELKQVTVDPNLYTVGRKGV